MNTGDTPELHSDVATSEVVFDPKQTSREPQKSDTPPVLTDEVAGHHALPARRPRTTSSLLLIVLYIFLLVAGIVVGIVARGVVENSGDSPNVPSPASVTPFPSMPVPAESWQQHQVLTGVTGEEVQGITYELPQYVNAPLCDGIDCASAGTYLPGGTRFTVALRGEGQVLPDWRQSQITDASGRVFTTRSTTVAGNNAVEFIGLFAGSTTGGYTFSRMRGVMVDVTPLISLEVNHFSPTGIPTDFEEDDALFDEIVGSIRINPELVESGLVSTSSATPTGTSSGTTR